jgi:rod shape-determining protein MreD
MAVAIFLALALQTTVAFSLASHAAVDLVLVVVVFLALSAGPEMGLLGGSVAGLAQDALAGGVIGVGGLAKSLVGFLTGLVATQFIVVGAAHRFVVFFLASLLNAGVFVGLYRLIDPRGVAAPWSAVLMQALVNAVIGILAFRIVEGTPGWLQGRRMRRSALRSRGRI